MTDERHAADWCAAATALPRGAGVVVRHYRARDRVALARALARLCRQRGLRLLIAGDPGLARAIGAHGVHLPERQVRRAGARHRGGKNWLITAAAHDFRGLLRAQRCGADAAFLSPVFATASHPGATPLGVRRFAALVRRAPLPVYALGGIDAATAPRLSRSGAVGVAAIDALIQRPRKRGSR